MQAHKHPWTKRCQSSGTAILPLQHEHRRFKTHSRSLGCNSAESSLDCPTGPVQFSSGLEYRRETENVTGDPLANMGLLHADYDPPTSAASFNVKGGLCGRRWHPYSRISHSLKCLKSRPPTESQTTTRLVESNAWKVGGQWAPVEDFRIRVTDATSVRAPNLTELDSPRCRRTDWFTMIPVVRLISTRVQPPGRPTAPRLGFRQITRTPAFWKLGSKMSWATQISSRK